MFFKGTKKRPTALEIASTIDSVGAEFNAYTGKESTGFYVKSAAQQLPLALDVLTDIISDSLFDVKEIEKEKGVIIEEINMREDMPMAMVGEVFDELLYKTTPLGQRIIGKKANIKKMQRQAFLDYLERFYQPKNMVITIAGDCSSLMEGVSTLHKQALNDSLVALQRCERLGSKNDHFAILKKFSFSQTKPQLKLHYKKTEQAHFCLGVRGFKRTHSDRYVLSVLATILGGNMSSRLFTEVREKKGLAYYIKTSIGRFHETGYLVTQAGVDVNKIEEAIKVILAEYQKAVSVTAEELKKAKEFLKGRLILALEDSRAVAALYGESELLENKIKTPQEIIKGIEKVTLEDLARVAKKLFLPKNLNLATIGPCKQKSRFAKILKL